jgi:hypothetical protein
VPVAVSTASCSVAGSSASSAVAGTAASREVEAHRSVGPERPAIGTVVAVLAALLAVAVLVAAVALALLVVRSGALRRSQAEVAQLTTRAEEAERSRDDQRRRGDELERSARELAEESERRGADLAASRARVGALEASLRDAGASFAERAAALDAAVDELAALEQRLGELERARRHVALDEGTAAACWELLIARVERQWAAGVAARPEERGLADRPADQLAQAVGRELERLREEVGVHAEGAASDGFDADPLVTLLVVGEALAVLAPHAERIRVDLGGEVVVVGEDWTGPAAGLERVRAAAAATGLLRRLEVADGRVEVSLAPPAAEPVEA